MKNQNELVNRLTDQVINSDIILGDGLLPVGELVKVPQPSLDEVTSWKINQLRKSPATDNAYRNLLDEMACNLLDAEVDAAVKSKGRVPDDECQKFFR